MIVFRMVMQRTLSNLYNILLFCGCIISLDNKHNTNSTKWCSIIEKTEEKTREEKASFSSNVTFDASAYIGTGKKSTQKKSTEQKEEKEEDITSINFAEQARQNATFSAYDNY